jgi:hypothetical protein
VLLADAGQRHAVCASLRHLRLLAARPERLRDQAPGALLRVVMMVLRELPRSRQAPALDAPLQRELVAIADRTRAAALHPASTTEMEERMGLLAAVLWPTADNRKVAREGNSFTPTVELLGA